MTSGMSAKSIEEKGRDTGMRYFKKCEDCKGAGSFPINQDNGVFVAPHSRRCPHCEKGFVDCTEEINQQQQQHETMWEFVERLSRQMAINPTWQWAYDWQAEAKALLESMKG